MTRLRFARPNAPLRRALLALAGALALGPSATTAQALDAPLPRDTAVHEGTLPNGVRYYVRRNDTPARRAELRLVVDAGSVLEDSTQQGLAHFLEHLAFNGTRRFGKLEIQHYLESIGMRFGADLNASTSYDETIYRLTLPTDRPDALATGIRILADWAYGITFDSATVEEERGIILSEWRSRTGPSQPIQARYAGLLFAGTPYAERMPIGKPAIIETAPPSEIERFYRDWYRPENMAVVIVGDIEPDSVIRLLRTQLGTFRRSDPPRPRPTFAFARTPETVVDVVVSPHVKGASTTITYRQPVAPRGTVGALRWRLLERLVHIMLGERARQLEAGTVATEEPARDLRAFSLRTSGPTAELRRDLARLLGVVERVRHHGFTASELELARQWLRGEYDRYYREGDARRSATYATAYVRTFLTDRVPTDSDEHERYVRAQLDGPTAITLAEVNDSARVWLGGSGRIIFEAVAAADSTQAPTVQEVLALADSIARHPPPPPADTLVSAPILATVPTPGRVVAEHPIPAIGATEWRLSNGTRVLLRPTDFNDTEVLFFARAPGGVSVAADSDYVEAHLADDLVAVSGLGAFSKQELRRRIAGRTVSISSFIAEIAHGLRGNAAPDDVELLLQLAHLFFTAPRVDAAAVAERLDETREHLSTSQAGIARALRTVMTQRHPRGRPLTPAMLDSLDAGRALEFFRERFADASAFTFYLVGAFDPDSIRPLVERYLASLPSSEREETWRDHGVRPPAGPGTVNVKGPPATHATTHITFSGPMRYDARENLLLNSLGVMLERRLLQRLRTELQATYGVRVGVSTEQWPYSNYQLTVTFDAAPERADELTAAARAVIDTLILHGPTEQEVDELRALQRRRVEEGIQTNGYWLAQLSHYDWNGWDFASGITSIEPLLDGVTVRGLQEAAQRYLVPGHSITAIIRPSTALHGGR